MKKQKNIFQLERENELLKQNLITSELSKININDSIILNFSENTSYFEKIAELINLYEIDSYLIYFIIKPKLEEKLDIFELSNDIKTILSLTIQPFSPIFKVDSDIFIFAFAFSNSEIKAKLNLFLYQLNQSILSSILDVEIIVFSILNCLEKIETNINIVEHFNNKLKEAILEKNKQDYSKIFFANLKDSIISPEVFLIEPDAFNAAIVLDILKNYNINCIWFRDGKQAYEKAKTSNPICIISEIAVPGLGGFDIRQKLLEEEINIPVIILSSQKNDDLIKTASLLGINYYLKKPYYISELVSLIKIFISANI